MSKYYTPQLEEFYIGFEYEEYHDPIHYKVKNDSYRKWNKKIFNGKHTIVRIHQQDDSVIDFFRPELNSEYFRVKYLDSSDIESLGFKETLKGLNQFCSNSFVINTDYSDENNCAILTILNKHEDIYFRGLVKNKSELKQLLYKFGWKDEED